ncbi:MULTISPECIES: hypothetical protein [unclassified Photobacterium]|uniref:hypothetical protein n=1 Tax=unclassified Photobacterium TaxID=2628852 RepID=UPI000D16CBF6|nr:MULTISPECIES: hypothetical protein [unclassified Photobacterium]PSV27782.1 hypothetical protein C9J42_05320 [Photobacterium sp. GB-56]PSV30928.1 hypothetical protein C9J44_20400 [Photobacterium sp. GB-27]PSV38514.1 hypothetical protein C9J38_08540 [Photobacterium sp. GB-210]PSV45861.1 hypothetical protein C9J46_04930 [Photobacterium sp. GB-36]PSV50730.1 hypothetical protein C9J45_18640 [Photobacterium sp. GB-1]
MFSDVLWFVPFMILFLIFNLLFIRKRKKKSHGSYFSHLKTRLNTYQSMLESENEEDDSIIEDDFIEEKPIKKQGTKKPRQPDAIEPAKKTSQRKTPLRKNTQIDSDHWLNQKAKRTPANKP